MKKAKIYLKKLFIITLSLLVLVNNTSFITVMAQEATQSASITPSAPVTPTPTELSKELEKQSTDPTTATPSPSLDINNQEDLSATLQPEKEVLFGEKTDYQPNEEIKVVLQNVDASAITTTVIGQNGEKVAVGIGEEEQGAQTTLHIVPPSQFIPGKYTLTIKENGQVLGDKMFTWGVLAINTNKSMYLPNEQAKLAMAVLDEKGEMVCDAKLTLRITDPAGEIKVLTTSDNSIIVNPECKVKNVTTKPDYQAGYEVNNPGIYTLDLEAETKNGSHSISDTFEVRGSVPFDVERSTATRIYPVKAYPVTFHIKATEDFEGTIEEQVPSNFAVLPAVGEGVQSYDEVSTDSASLGTQIKDIERPQLHLPFTSVFGISQGFGESPENELQKAYEQYGLHGHDGVDFELPDATEVVAVDEGEVINGEGDAEPYGKTVIIKHSWGTSYYGHFSSISVKKGDIVEKGDKIGMSGSTGFATGPHLHFGIRPANADIENGYSGKVDPLPYLGIGEDPNILPVANEGKLTSKVITWKVSLLKGQTYSLGYQYDAPNDSPEFYLLGPLTFKKEGIIQTFAEARLWQIASDTPDGTGMMVYDTDAANAETPHNRTWTPSDLSSEGNMRADGTMFEDVNHTVIEPGTTRNEYIRASQDASGVLNVEVYGGSSWAYGTGAPSMGNFTTSIGTTDDVKRSFDVAYEKTSGDGLVVYEDTTTDNKTLKYRTWNGTTWSAEGTLDYTSVAEGSTDDQAEWIEMETRLNASANEIMLGWKDTAGDGVYGAVWDGSAWQNIALINGAGINTARRSFDVAWEGTSDQGMIVYGTGTTTDFSVYDISAASWTDGSSSSNPGEAVDWLSAAGDPSSDYIAMIITSGASTTTSDAAVDIWNGTNWTTVATPTDDTDIDTYGFSQGADVAWEQSSSDRALFVWRDDATNDTLTTLNYMDYDISANQFQEIDDNAVCLLTEGGAGTIEAVTSLANAEDSGGPCTGAGLWAGTVSGIKAIPDPSSKDIMVLGENETTLDIRPEAQLWNGDANGSWLTQTANMGAFETDASPGTLPTAAIPVVAYDFAWRTSSADNTGMLVYDEDGANVDQPPHYRTWSGTDLSAESNQLDYLSATSSESTFDIIAAAPTRNEYIGGRLTSDGHLNIQIWDGDSWEYGSGAPDGGVFTINVGTTRALTRGFDIAYEDTSGDALVVYEDTSTANKTLKYRTWDGSTWSSEQSLDYSAVAEGGSNDVTGWVELEGDDGSNNIMLGWQDVTGLGYYGSRWDGSAWQNISLINGAGVNIARQGFDVAWEGTSGDGMLAYITGTTIDASSYTTGGGFADTSSASVVGAITMNWLQIAGSPNNDYIALMTTGSATALSTTLTLLDVDMWNGSNWTSITVPDDDEDINTYGFSRSFDVTWEVGSSSDRALFAWRDGTTAETSVRYMIFDISVGQFLAVDDDGAGSNVCNLTGTLTNQQVTDLSSAENSNGPCSVMGTWAGTISGITLTPDPGSRKIMLLSENETVLDIKPEAQLWDGVDSGTWLSQTATMGAFEPDASTGVLPTAALPSLPYAFAFRSAEPLTLTQSAYQWFANADDLQPGSSLASESTAASATVGTAVRLRNALTTGGVNLPASMQQFKLQSATSTSGPWTDVENANNGWWNANYAYRKKITITTTSATPTDYATMVTIDHAALVTATKSQADGDDIRIVYTGGGSATELDRVLEDGSAWNNAATSIWFKTQASIGASTTDSSYYMYYGYASASSPPANSANVFLMYDDFEDGNTTGWTNRESSDTTWTVSSGVLNGTVGVFGGGVGHEFSYNVGSHTDTVIEARVMPPSDVATDHYQGFTGIRRTTAGAGYYFVSSDTSNSQQLIAEATTWNGQTGDFTAAEVLTTDTWYRQKFSAVGTTLSGKTWVDGTAEPAWESTGTDATYASGTEISLGTGSIANDHIKFDWVRVRKEVTTEPSDSLGSETATADVTWLFKLNATPVDGTVITTALLSGSPVKESYEEDNPTVTNPTNIPVSSKGEWDFSLDSTNAAITTYYFRMVKSSGTVLDTYTVYPQIAINAPGPTTDQVLRHGTWFSGGVKQPFTF